MATQIVHDDDIAGRERRDQELGDIGGEALVVDGTVKDARGVDPIMPQRGKEGQRAPLAKGCLGDELAAARCPAPDRRHVGLGPRFIDEDETPRIKSTLILLPLLASSRDRWPVLLLGEQAFF